MAFAEDLRSALENVPFGIEPQTPAIGALITGLDLREEQSDDVIAGLRAALLQWKVIFFRDQHLTQEQHIAFGKRFGKLEIHPLTPVDQANPEILRIIHDENRKGSENAFHSDVTWRPEPSLGSILRAVELPAVGGDTLWADMEAAYDNLPAPIKEKVTGLTAEHNFLRAFGHLIDEKEHAATLERHPKQYHPVIRTHPETGRRSIYVNIGFTDRIMDLPQEESDFLLEFLERTAHTPEYQVRLKWQPGTIAFWDNRSTQHYAVSDYFPHRRVMERVTVCGDKPFFDPKAG